MPTTNSRKDHPLSMRLPETDIAVIDRAASLSGSTRTEFIRSAAVRAAEDAILDNTLIRMSPAGFDAFMAILERPPATVPELQDLFSRRAPWEPETPGDRVP